MKTKSAKAKGRRLQDQIVSDLKETFGVDIRAAIMGETGTDIKLSEAAKAYFAAKLGIVPAIESKNVEKLALWEALKQCEANADGGDPILIFTRNRAKTYAVLEWKTLLWLLRTIVNAES